MATAVNGKLAESKIQNRKSKMAPRTLRVAIIGKAPSSMGLAPYGDASWEVWTLNDTNYRMANIVPRWDRHFELHDVELTKEARYEQYFPWLCQDHGKPIYVRDERPEIPNGVRYPYERVFAAVGRRYFTNSISYMLGLAIAEGATEIGLYGVDMAQHGNAWRSEYARQRPSCEWLIGLAEGRGIKVVVPDESDILKCKGLYGFDSGEQSKKYEARQKELEQRIKQHEMAEEQNHDAAQYLRGALDQLFYDRQWIQ